MANIVIQLSSAQLSSALQEVYLDVDMLATRKIAKLSGSIDMTDRFALGCNIDQNENNPELSNCILEATDKNGNDKLLEAVKLNEEKYKAYEQVLQLRSNEAIAKLVNVKAVQNSVKNIFSWTKGERILNPEFGTNLRQYLYEGISEFNIEQIISEIRNCFVEFEPRAQLVKVVNVSTVQDTENNTVHLEIIYAIPSLTDEQFAYSFMYNRTM